LAMEIARVRDVDVEERNRSHFLTDSAPPPRASIRLTFPTSVYIFLRQLFPESEYAYLVEQDQSLCIA